MLPVSEDRILLFLAQMLVVLALARILGELARRFGQPPFAGEILAGLVLGQTVLGHVAPQAFASLFPPDQLQRAMFGVTADIGILFLLLVVGLEVNVGAAWRMRQQTMGVAVTGVFVPMLLGTAAAWFMYDSWIELDAPRLAFSLLVGAGVSITAITVVARMLFDLNIVKSDLGLFLVSAMAINELLGWLVLAVVLGLVGASGGGSGAQGVDVRHLSTVILVIVAFTAVASTVGRRVVTRILPWLRSKGLPSPATPLSFVVCLGLLGGIVTASVGIHPVFGFLVAGLMASDPRALPEHTRSIIAQMVEAVFVPLFFAGICLHVDFARSFDLWMVVSVTALSIAGKFIGAGLGTRFVNMPNADRLPAAIAHVPGGPMGVLLATVAKEANVIGPKMFVAIVVASIVSSVIVGPAFAWALRRRETRNVLGFLSPATILPDLADLHRDGVIATLSELAASRPGMPSAEVIRSAVASREDAMGTGIGHGMAVPHARLAGVPRPVVAVGLSRAGVDWDAVDDQPVHLVFLIVTPEDQHGAQLDILSSVAKAFADPDARQRLVRTGDREAAAELLEQRLKASLAG